MAKLISVVVLAFFLAAGMPMHGEEAVTVDQASSEQAGANGDGQQAVKGEKKDRKSKAKKGKRGKKSKKGKGKSKKDKKSKKGKKGKKDKKPKKEKPAAAAEDEASEWVQPEGSAQ